MKKWFSLLCVLFTLVATASAFSFNLFSFFKDKNTTSKAKVWTFSGSDSATQKLYNGPFDCKSSDTEPTTCAKYYDPKRSGSHYYFYGDAGPDNLVPPQNTAWTYLIHANKLTPDVLLPPENAWFQQAYWGGYFCIKGSPDKTAQCEHDSPAGATAFTKFPIYGNHNCNGAGWNACTINISGKFNQVYNSPVNIFTQVVGVSLRHDSVKPLGKQSGNSTGLVIIGDGKQYSYFNQDGLQNAPGYVNVQQSAGGELLLTPAGDQHLQNSTLIAKGSFTVADKTGEANPDDSQGVKCVYDATHGNVYYCTFTFLKGLDNKAIRSGCYRFNSYLVVMDKDTGQKIIVDGPMKMFGRWNSGKYFNNIPVGVAASTCNNGSNTTALVKTPSLPVSSSRSSQSSVPAATAVATPISLKLVSTFGHRPLAANSPGFTIAGTIQPTDATAGSTATLTIKKIDDATEATVDLPLVSTGNGQFAFNQQYIHEIKSKDGGSTVVLDENVQYQATVNYEGLSKSITFYVDPIATAQPSYWFPPSGSDSKIKCSSHTTTQLTCTYKVILTNNKKFVGDKVEVEIYNQPRATALNLDDAPTHLIPEPDKMGAWSVALHMPYGKRPYSTDSKAFDFTLVEGSPMIQFIAKHGAQPAFYLEPVGNEGGSTHAWLFGGPELVPGLNGYLGDVGSNSDGIAVFYVQRNKTVLCTKKKDSSDCKTPRRIAAIQPAITLYYALYVPPGSVWFQSFIQSMVKGNDGQYVANQGTNPLTAIHLGPVSASPTDADQHFVIAELPAQVSEVCGKPGTTNNIQCVRQFANQYAKYAFNYVSGSTVKYKIGKDGKVTTTFHLDVSDTPVEQLAAVTQVPGKALIGLLPHQYQNVLGGSQAVLSLGDSAYLPVPSITAELGKNSNSQQFCVYKQDGQQIATYTTISGCVRTITGTGFTTTYQYYGMLPYMPLPPASDKAGFDKLKTFFHDYDNWHGARRYDVLEKGKDKDFIISVTKDEGSCTLDTSKISTAGAVGSAVTCQKGMTWKPMPVKAYDSVNDYTKLYFSENAVYQGERVPPTVDSDQYYKATLENTKPGTLTIADANRPLFSGFCSNPNPKAADGGCGHSGFNTYDGGKRLNQMVQAGQITAQLAARLAASGTPDSAYVEKRAKAMFAATDTMLAKWFDGSSIMSYSSKGQNAKNGTSVEEKTGSYYYAHDDHGNLLGFPTGYGAATNLNDHFFHYGYWVYSAAQLAMHKGKAKLDMDNWLDHYKNAINALVNDYAPTRSTQSDGSILFSGATGGGTYDLRGWDPYVGHANASGIDTSGDGPNIESSSEQINAYAAMVLWGAVSNQPEIRDEGIYLYTTAIRSAYAYWFCQGDGTCGQDVKTTPPEDLDNVTAHLVSSGNVVCQLAGPKSDPLAPVTPSYAKPAGNYYLDNFMVGAEGAATSSGIATAMAQAALRASTMFGTDGFSTLAINVVPVTGSSLYLGHIPGQAKKNVTTAYSLIENKDLWTEMQNGVTCHFKYASHGANREYQNLVAAYAALNGDVVTEDDGSVVQAYWSTQSPYCDGYSDNPDGILSQTAPNAACIDGGDTRLHTYDWIRSLYDYGTPFYVTPPTDQDGNLWPLYAVFSKNGEKTYTAYNSTGTKQTVNFANAPGNCQSHVVAPYSLWVCQPDQSPYIKILKKIALTASTDKSATFSWEAELVNGDGATLDYACENLDKYGASAGTIKTCTATGGEVTDLPGPAPQSYTFSVKITDSKDGTVSKTLSKLYTTAGDNKPDTPIFDAVNNVGDELNNLNIRWLENGYPTSKTDDYVFYYRDSSSTEKEITSNELHCTAPSSTNEQRNCHITFAIAKNSAPMTLQPGKVYTGYGIAVKNVGVDPAVWSDWMVVPSFATAPTRLTILSVKPTDDAGKYSIQWTSPEMRQGYSFEIQNDDGQSAVPTLTVDSCAVTSSTQICEGTLTNVDAAKTYQLQLRVMFANKSTHNPSQPSAWSKQYTFAPSIPITRVEWTPEFNYSDVTSDSAKLTWNSATVVGESNADLGYTIQSISPAITTTPVIEGDSVTLTGLRSGTEYTVTVRAQDKVSGAYADMTATFTTVSGMQPVISWNASAANFLFSDITPTSATLNWKATAMVAGKSSNNLTYTASIAPTGTVVQPTPTQAQFTGLQPNTQYTVTVAVEDSVTGGTTSVKGNFTTKAKVSGLAPQLTGARYSQLSRTIALLAYQPNTDWVCLQSGASCSYQLEKCTSRSGTSCTLISNRVRLLSARNTFLGYSMGYTGTVYLRVKVTNAGQTAVSNVVELKR